MITLFDYNYWANARVLAAAERVTPEQYAAPAGLSHGSLHATLVHTLSAETLWRQRCQDAVSPAALLKEADFPTLALLLERWQAEERLMRAFLASLAPGELERIVRYTTTNGAVYENKLWSLLMQVINHGMQCRAEAGMALTAYGQSPGDLDFIFYLRETAARDR
jgi:uncharacterized damage-inducible protein DinB